MAETKASTGDTTPKKPTTPKKTPTKKTPVKKPAAKRKPAASRTTSKNQTAQKISPGAAKAEATLTKAVDGAKRVADKVTHSKVAQEVQEFAHNADQFAETVDTAAEKADAFVQDHLPNTGGSDGDIVVEWEENVSRLFIFRFLWLIIEIWVMYAWGIWIGVISFIHFFSMLFMGKRNKYLWDKQVRFYRHITKWNLYLRGMTDKRPEFITPA